MRGSAVMNARDGRYETRYSTYLDNQKRLKVLPSFGSVQTKMVTL